MAKRRPQGDGTIRKRSDGRWEARIIIGHKNDGSPMYKSAFAKTQKSALKQLHQLIDLYRDVDLTEDSRMTLGEWLDKWLDEYMIFTIRESTLDSYRAMVKNQVKPFIGSKQISSLTTADMQKFYNKIKKEGRVREHPIHGKSLADSMVRGVHMMLHEALDAAVKERLLAKNPTNGTTVPKCNYPEKQILGDNQLETFLEAIKGHEYWCDFFYVEVMTGLRRGEICGLSWGDVDFDRRVADIRHSYDYMGNLKATKTKAGTRVLPLSDKTIQVLKAHKETQFKRYARTNQWRKPEEGYIEQTDDSPVISDNSGTRVLPTSLSRWWTEDRAKYGLDGWCLHEFRHTYLTLLAINGVHPKVMQELAGHYSSQISMDIYTHVNMDSKREAVAAVASVF